MKRKIIRIDEEKCNGCGACVTGCAEGALAIIHGKARLVKEQFCDGLGACIGECPTGALTIEEREAEAFDASAVPAPAAAHQPGHACPGSAMRFQPRAKTTPVPSAPAASALEQWPVQIHLVQPGAPFFHGRELAVLSTCAPVAMADVHHRFIRGRGVVVGCPKLDRTEGYVEKLAAILSDPTIPKVLVVRMQVPCCGGLTVIVRAAAERSGRKDLIVEEVTVGLDGTVM